MLFISYSRASSYLHCPYQHYLSYVKCLKLNRPVRPLYFGSDFHKLLELRNKPDELHEAMKNIGDAYYDLSANFQSQLGEDYVENLSVIFSDYQHLYHKELQPQKTEQKFQILVGKYKDEPVYFIGILDELYLLKKHGKKFIMIGEHKTFNQKPKMNVLVMNTQKCLYAKATQIEKGILPESVIWDYIKSTPARYPVWLDKAGRFSTAKSESITPMSWRRACRLKGITDKEILHQGRMYHSNIQNFFFKVNMPYDVRMVEDIWDGFKYTCKEIARQGYKNKTKNVTRDCDWCDFKDICYAEFTGADVGYILKKSYVVEERHEASFLKDEVNT